MNSYGQTALCRVFPWSRECPGRAAWKVPKLQLCEGRVILRAASFSRCSTGQHKALPALPVQIHTPDVTRSLGEGFQCDFKGPTQNQASTFCAGWGESCAWQKSTEDIPHRLQQGEHKDWDLSLFIYFTTFLLFIVTDGCRVRGAENDAWGFFIFQEATHWKVWNLLCVFTQKFFHKSFLS